MESDVLEISKLSSSELRGLIEKRWPKALDFASAGTDLMFSTGISALDIIFPRSGISYGQLIEIGGAVSSGKTSFLFRILANLTRANRAVYLDFSGSFFPSAAESSGVDISQVLVLRSNDLMKSLRAVELILRHRLACCIVFDLVGVSGVLPLAVMHRLRREILKAGALIIFLTENHPRIIPASMISLRLEVHRVDRSRIEITVIQSRISKAGIRIKWALGDE